MYGLVCVCACACVSFAHLGKKELVRVYGSALAGALGAKQRVSG